MNKLVLIYKKMWKEDIFNDKRKKLVQKNKLRTYRLFKDTFKCEKYLDNNNFKQRNIFCKFRIGCHKLEIETGRHNNIPVNERICKLCNMNIENEIHFLLQCQQLKKYRDTFIKHSLTDFPNLAQCNDRDLFVWLMSCENKLVINKICILIELLFAKRSEMLLHV